MRMFNFNGRSADKSALKSARAIQKNINLSNMATSSISSVTANTSNSELVKLKLIWGVPSELSGVTGQMQKSNNITYTSASKVDSKLINIRLETANSSNQAAAYIIIVNQTLLKGLADQENWTNFSRTLENCPIKNARVILYVLRDGECTLKASESILMKLSDHIKHIKNDCHISTVYETKFGQQDLFVLIKKATMVINDNNNNANHMQTNAATCCANPIINLSIQGPPPPQQQLYTAVTVIDRPNPYNTIPIIEDLNEEFDITPTSYDTDHNYMNVDVIDMLVKQAFASGYDLLLMCNFKEVKDNNLYLSIEKKNGSMKNQEGNVGNLQGYIQHDVIGNGECGYIAFGIIRGEDNREGGALKLLNDNLLSIANIIQPAVKEGLRSEEFIAYLNQNGFNNLTFDSINSTNENFNKFAINLNVIQQYINYDVRDKKINLGWLHPSVLQALAHIQKLEIRMWRMGDQNVIVPHKIQYASYEQDFSVYIPENKQGRVDLLFVNNNHFNKVEFKGYENGFPNDDERVYPIKSLGNQKNGNTCLCYKTKKANGEIINGKIENMDIDQSCFSRIEEAIKRKTLQDISEKDKNTIFDITSKRGHTPPTSYDTDHNYMNVDVIDMLAKQAFASTATDQSSATVDDNNTMTALPQQRSRANDLVGNNRSNMWNGRAINANALNQSIQNNITKMIFST